MSRLEEYRNTLKTDLACERRRADTSLPGTEYSEYEMRGMPVTRLRIRSRESADAIGKPEGTYFTVGFDRDFGIDPEKVGVASEVLLDLIGSLLPERNGKPLFVVGLGNAELTADAVGPETARNILATSHTDPGGIAVLAPGVTGQSGIEAARLVRAAAREIGARGVIVIDALCTSSLSRLACTVQISDTGITPGSGIREPRAAIDRNTVGVPVIAVGVPTMMSSAALVCDALESAGADEIPEDFKALLAGSDCYVCPRCIDEGVSRAAVLIAEAINRL